MPDDNKVALGIMSALGISNDDGYAEEVLTRALAAARNEERTRYAAAIAAAPPYEVSKTDLLRVGDAICRERNDCSIMTYLEGDPRRIALLNEARSAIAAFIGRGR